MNEILFIDSKSAQKSRDLGTLSWRRLDGFAEAQAVWQYLERVGRCSPFQTYDWLQSYYTAFDVEDGVELALVVSETNDGDPVALFPLCLRDRWGNRSLEWLGQPLNDYNGPILMSKYFDEVTQPEIEKVWDDIVACIGNVDLVYLLRQPSQIFGKRNPFAYVSSDIEASSAHSLKLDDSWPSFSKSIFSKSTLRRLKEKSKKLSKQGHVSFTWHTSPDDRSQAVTRILNWKCQQLEGTGAPNALEDVRSYDFLKRVASINHDALKIVTLDLDGVPISGIVTLAIDKGQLIYIMAYDQGPCSRQSPGMILLHYLIEHSINDNQELLDFSVGDETYKVALCKSKTEMRQTVRGYSKRGKAFAVFLRCRLQLKRRVKKSDPVMSFLKLGNKWRRQLKKSLTRPD